MALNLSQINRLRINEGTASTPFILSEAEVDTLFRLASEGREAFSIEGYVNTRTGQISKSLAYTIKKAFPKLHILATEVQDNSWAVYISSQNIKEGESVNIRAVNIETASLACEIQSISVTVYSGSMTEIGVRDALTVDMIEGKLSVANPVSNASWVASVRLRFYPKYLENDLQESDNRYSTFTISAIGITSIQVDMPTEINKYQRATLVSTLAVPENNTKKEILYFEGSTQIGTFLPQSWNLGDEVFYTHNGTEATDNVEIRCKVGSNIVAIEQKQVIITGPRIVVNISADESLGFVPSIILTDPDGVEHEMNNGDSIPAIADGTKTYTISWTDFHGFKVKAPTSVTPTSLNTVVNVIYEVVQPDVYIVYSDGTMENYDTLYDRNFKFKQGYTKDDVVGIGIETADCGFMISPKNEHTGQKWSTNTVLVNAEKATGNVEIVSTYFEGKEDTQKIIDYYERDPSNSAPAAEFCYSKKIIVGGVEKRGYLPQIGELITLRDNIDKVNKIKSMAFLYETITTTRGQYWSCAERNASEAWALHNGTPSTAGFQFQSGTVKYNTPYAIPFYKL